MTPALTPARPGAVVGGKTAPPTTTNAGTRLARIKSITLQHNSTRADGDDVAVAASMHTSLKRLKADSWLSGP